MIRDVDELTIQTAVVKESLRITALVTSRLPLVSPKESLSYGNWNIPPGVSSLRFETDPHSRSNLSYNLDTGQYDPARRSS